MKKFNVICIVLLLCAAIGAAVFFALRSCDRKEQTIYVPSAAESSEMPADPSGEPSGEAVETSDESPEVSPEESPEESLGESSEESADETGYAVLLTGPCASHVLDCPSRAEAGETVTVRTEVVFDAVIHVTVDGEEIEPWYQDYDGWKFSFTMPDRDATLYVYATSAWEDEISEDAD